MHRFIFLCFCAIILIAGCKKSIAPDTIIIHAKIWSDSVINDFDAIAIKADKIIEIGYTSDLISLKSESTQIIDADHRLLTPGFIDAHVHFLDGGYNLSSVQLRDAASRDTFIQRIRAFAQTVPKGSWITGGDWNHELWGGQLPERWWIDSVTPDHPVVINRLDGHMILCNSLAMKLAGVDNGTKDIPGGEIPRNSKNEIIGIFKDNAAGLIYAKMPPVSTESKDRALAAAMRYVASHGVTGIHHMGTFDDLETFRRNKSTLITRIYAATPLAQWRRLLNYNALNGKGDSLLHWGLLKGFMDGSLGSHTAAMHQEFSDKPGDKGFFINSLDSMSQWVLHADKAGLQIAVHAIGDNAIHSLLNIFDSTTRINGARDRRFRVEHFQHPAALDIPRMQKLAIIASMQPYHAIDDGCWAEKVIGKERIKTTYAFRSVLQQNIHLAFGSDWFVAPPAPLLGIYAAVTRRTIDGKNPTGWVPSEKITVSQALQSYTKESAYAGFVDHHIGQIKKGFLADLVLLEQDILSADPDRMTTYAVKWTMMGGKIIYTSTR